MKRPEDKTASFLEHVYELRKRLIISVLSLIVGAGIGYSLLDQLISILSKPFGKTLYYSAPTGQLSFIIKVCLLFGVITASPMIIYQIAKFVEPLFKKRTRFRLFRYMIAAAALAVSGACFAYFLSLPLTLEFLTKVEKGTSSIAPLISADEYFNFVIAYIGGFAILFQIPLIVTIVNNIHPLDPKGFLTSLRYVVVLSFIVAAIVTPTPDPINQAIMAVPVVGLYIMSGIILVFAGLFKKKFVMKDVATPEKIIENPKPQILVDFKKIKEEETVGPSSLKQAAAIPKVVLTGGRYIDGFLPTPNKKLVNPRTNQRIAPRQANRQRITHRPSPQRLITDFRSMG